MQKRCICLLLFSFGQQALACRMEAPIVSDQDIKNAPSDMLAVKAVIKKILPNGSVKHRPHAGFRLELDIVKVFQGSDLGTSLLVHFGPCHNLPGKPGDKINVLARKDKKNGWYAPQFWRKVQSRLP